MSLQDVIAAVQDIAGAIGGIRAAPEYLPEQVSVFPFLACYAGSGSFEFGVAGEMRGLHNIVLELHVARKDLARDIEAAMAYSDTIPAALMADCTLGGTVSTFGRITYAFQGMEYGGVQTIGFRFTLEAVKLNTIL